MTMSLRAGGVIRGRSLPCPLMSLAIWWIWVLAPALHNTLLISFQTLHTTGALRRLTCKGLRQLNCCRDVDGHLRFSQRQALHQRQAEMSCIQ